jgi:hypothetical protein
MLQTIKAFVDTNRQIQLLEPVKFAKKPALVIILNDNEATTDIENVLFTEKDWNKPAENETGLHGEPTITAHRKLKDDMIAALKQDAKDHVYQAEIMAWDSVVGDGIDAKK